MKLYHGTYSPDLSTCEMIRPGYDGMTHFSMDQDLSSDFYPRVLECDGEIDVDSLPTLPDLGHWSPFRMAEVLQDKGLITPEDRRRVEGNPPPGYNARDAWAPYEVIQTYGDYLELDEGEARSIPIRRLIEMASRSEDVLEDFEDDSMHPDIQMKLLNINEAATARLMGVMRERGIRAFRYENDYEDLGPSVAVIDPSVITTATVVQTEYKPLSGPTHSVERPSLADAVADYKDAESRERERAYVAPPSSMEYRSASMTPSYSQRAGRGRMY